MAMARSCRFVSLSLLLVSWALVGGCSLLDEDPTVVPELAGGDEKSGEGEGLPVDEPLVAVAMASMTPYAAVQGEVAVDVALSRVEVVRKVELLVGDSVAAVSETAPFALAWDSTGTGDGLVQVSVRATDEFGRVTESDQLPLVILNRGAMMELIQGDTGTMVIPANFDGSQETHVKHHWMASRAYPRALGIFLWEPPQEGPDWEIELRMGIGTCPHNGMAFDPGPQSAGGATVIEVTPPYGLPRDTSLFIHAGAMNAHEHVGESLSYSVRVFAFDDAEGQGGQPADQTGCPVNSGYPCSCEGVRVCADGSDCVAFAPGAAAGICSAKCTGPQDAASCSDTLGFGSRGGCFAGRDPSSPDHCLLECVVGSGTCPTGQVCADQGEAGLCLPGAPEEPNPGSGSGGDAGAGGDSGPDGAGPPCYGVSNLGCCDGSMVYFCEMGALQSLDCAPYACGWSERIGMFKCNGQDTPPAGVPFDCPASLAAAP
jgi:hypothetical protein